MGPKPKHRWHICEKKKRNKFFYYTIKYVKIQIQKFFKIAFDCNLESNANSCPKALGIGKSSKDIEGGNVSKILDAANDCSELTNCKIHTLYSNSSNVPRQNKVAHKNLNHQAWMPSKYCDLLFTYFCINVHTFWSHRRHFMVMEVEVKPAIQTTGPEVSSLVDYGSCCCLIIALMASTIT